MLCEALFLWSTLQKANQTPYLSSCMFPEPQTEWSCCPGWSWQTGPADRTQTARVPAVAPRRTSTRLRPGHRAPSGPHSGRSSVQWGHESPRVDSHAAWARTGERRSDKRQATAQYIHFHNFKGAINLMGSERMYVHDWQQQNHEVD